MPHKLLLFIFISIAVAADAQTADSVKRSPARLLTYAKFLAYSKGEADNELALAGTLNHYPLPDDVLKYKKELELTPEQVKKLTDIYTYMHKRRLQTGASIIKNERTLDSLFRYHKMDEGALIFFTNRYGLYQGELRNAILFACYSTAKEISPEQLARYEALKKAH